MKKRALTNAGLLAVISFLLAGCSGMDDLQVTNHFAFAVRLQAGGKTIGTLAPGETRTFDRQGGYKGSAAEHVSCVDAQGKSLGPLGKAAHDVQRESNGSLNGSGVLTAILGP